MATTASMMTGGGMMDLMIGNMWTSVLMNKFTELLTGKITLATLVKLGLMMVLLESKDSLKEWGKKAPPSLWTCLQRLVRRMASVRRSSFEVPPLLTPLPVVEKPKYHQKIDFLPDPTFLASLYLYLGTQESACRRKERSIKLINAREQQLEEEINQVVFTLGSIKYELTSTLTYTISLNTQKVLNCQVTEVTTSGSFLSLLTEEQTEVVLAFTETLTAAGWTQEKILSGIDNMGEKAFTTNKLALLVSKKNQFPYDTTLYYIRILVAILCRCHIYGDIYFANFANIASLSRLFIDRCNKYTLEDLKDIPHEMANPQMYYCSVGTFAQLYKSTTNDRNLFKEYANDTDPLRNKLVSTSQLILSSEEPIKLSLAIQALLETVKKNGAPEVASVEVYSLKLVEETRIKKEENPDYLDWQKQKKLTEELAKADPKILRKFAERPIPPEEITVVTKVKLPKKAHLNTLEKDISSLYLKESDMDNLMTCLKQFKEDKLALKNFGLQNKLNVLLYGPPGTGKSMTIDVIACYLQRNIYNINLSLIKTSEDFQLLLNYVNDEVVDGGLIVMEDIDEMSEIVYQRTGQLEVGKKVEEGAFTLDYLLNVLQGTLTKNNSVFIISTNYVNLLDTALIRDGRFDVKLELLPCNHHQIQSIYKVFIGRTLNPEILALIPESLHTPATIIYHLRKYIYRRNLSDSEILAKFLPSTSPSPSS